MRQAGIAPVDVIDTLGRNMTAKKSYTTKEGDTYEVDDGPTQIHAASILLKGMHLLTGGGTTVTVEGGPAPQITFGMPDLNADPDDFIEGEASEVA